MEMFGLKMSLKKHDFVLSLPTRDGNAKEMQEAIHKLGCFEPTYKGWKFVCMRKLRPCYSRFEPTYKGWKLKTPPLPVITTVPCFEPTYKGWK